MDWDREFLPWLASLPEEDQLELVDLMLLLSAAMMDQRFQGRVSQTALPTASRPVQGA